jgi:ATP-binding cassette, subfamily F, member 2
MTLSIIRTPTLEKQKQLRKKFKTTSNTNSSVLAFNDVAFAWDGKKENQLYKNLDFGVDMDSRIALVGPNGAGEGKRN